MTIAGIKTQIPTLDGMLFGDEFYHAHEGFHGGEVVLVRGEPGSGKTTLALQIASNFLRDLQQQIDGRGGEFEEDVRGKAQFITLEEPAEAMRQRCTKYGFFDTEAVTWVERAEIDALIEEVRRLHDIDRRSRAYRKAAMRIAEEAIEALRGFEPSLTVATLVARPFMDLLLTAILGRLVGRRARDRDSGDYPRLVVIDSLNALMNLLVRGLPEGSGRPVFNTFCQILRQWIVPKRRRGLVDPPVILIVGEHHFHEPDTEKYLPESFFCDAEVVLRPETVRLPRDSDPAMNMTLGYDLGAIVAPDAKHLESRSFCRVIKSRRSPRQSRRCAYDIESGEGFCFFETYPGDGKLMLFAENEQQRSAWGSFFNRDLLDSYPALRYETFTMEGLETVYESSRRRLNVPLRTDMYLSSLDSYWVTGYRDYRLKTRINERLCERMRADRRKHLGAPDGQRDACSSWACAVYPMFVNDLVHYTLLGFERDYHRNQLATSPSEDRATLEVRIAKLDREGHALRQDLVRNYDALCAFLFKDHPDIDTLLKDRKLLPAKHFSETLLRPLPRSQLTLYGQYDADILPSLVRQDMHHVEEGEDHWLFVPYDANVGVFVARLDLIEGCLSDHETRVRYADAYRALKQQEIALLREAQRSDSVFGCGLSRAFGDFQQACAGAIDECERALKDPTATLPVYGALERDPLLRLTWDQVISLSAAAQMPLGIETRSFDTLLAFFLELVSNCDGGLEVNGRYQIQEREKNLLPLLRALHYFGAIFALTPTPPDQTVDPCHYHAGPGGLPTYGRWLFARYWYSTLLDALTATRPKPGSPPTERKPQADGAGEEPAAPREFVWETAQNTRTPRVEIVAMPKGTDGMLAHYTCWGDWSFGLLEGSENVTLACDLISNLMGAVKVTERGLRGACLPTVSQFYWRFWYEPCVPASIRGDIHLPRMTFGELGASYLGTPPPPAHVVTALAAGRAATTAAAPGTSYSPKGIFRQSMFDYRHCAREIFNELLRIKRAASERSGLRQAKLEPRVFIDAAARIVHGIEDLYRRYVFIRDSFRHDAVEVASQHPGCAPERRHPLCGSPRIAGFAKPNVQFRGGPCTIQNLSLGGCCLRDAPPASNGDTFDFLLPASSTVRVTQKWRTPDASLAGYQFTEPLDSTTFCRALAALA